MIHTFKFKFLTLTILSLCFIIGLESCLHATSKFVITDLKWGSLKVNNQSYKDCRIWPNHVEEWDWTKTGTRHIPGIQIADLEDFMKDVDIVVLSEGVDGVLQTKPETLTYLQKNEKQLIKARTPQAVAMYNKLVNEGKRVGALIHTTC